MERALQEHSARPEASVPAPLGIELYGVEGSALRAILGGQIDYANAGAMQRQIAAGCEQHGGRDLILDLRGIDFLDSSALRSILHLHEERERSDGTLVILAQSDAVRGVLAVTGLERHLNVADTLQDAMKMLSTDEDDVA